MTDDETDTDTDSESESRLSAAKRRWARWRDRLRERPKTEFVYRIVVGVVGLAVFGPRHRRDPVPRPGWAIVFIGLGHPGDLVSTGRAGCWHYAKERYDKVMDWFQRQGLFVQILGGVLTALIVVGDAVAARCAGLGRLNSSGSSIRG